MSSYIYCASNVSIPMAAKSMFCIRLTTFDPCYNCLWNDSIAANWGGDSSRGLCRDLQDLSIESFWNKQTYSNKAIGTGNSSLQSPLTRNRVHHEDSKLGLGSNTRVLVARALMDLFGRIHLILVKHQWLQPLKRLINFNINPSIVSLHAIIPLRKRVFSVNPIQTGSRPAFFKFRIISTFQWSSPCLYISFSVKCVSNPIWTVNMGPLVVSTNTTATGQGRTCSH